MANRHLSLEIASYILILFLSFWVRWITLDNVPLSNLEADLALRSLAIFDGGVTNLSSQPGYVTLTGLLFFVGKSSETLSRLLSLVAGSLLTLFPFMIRKWLGKRASLITALGIALDPGLIAISRVAGGPMLGVSFGLLSLGAFITYRYVLAGILFGIAILSGPTIFIGISGAVVAYILIRRSGLIHSDFDEQNLFPILPRITSENRFIRSYLIASGSMLVLVGTLFFRVPKGLGGIVTPLSTFIAGISNSSDVSALRLIMTILSQQSFLIMFGTLTLVRNWFRRGDGRVQTIARVLSIWFFGTFVVILLYPGHQVADLSWVLVILWALASLEITRLFFRDIDLHSEDRMGLILAVIVLVLMGSIWVNLSGLVTVSPGEQMYFLRLLVILGALLLIGLSTALVYLGWSPYAAEQGILLGIGVALGVIFLSGIWSGNSRDEITRINIWAPGPFAGQTGLLMETLGDIGNWSSGRRENLDIVATLDNPSLRWLLRSMPNARFNNALKPGESPDAVISIQGQENLRLRSTYQGQNFVLSVDPSFESMSFISWIKLVLFREIPTRTENIVLWIREDLFPSPELLPTEVQTEPLFPSDSGEDEFIQEEEFQDREIPIK